MKKNAFYAQSGGVTAVINATAGALLLEPKNHKIKLVKFLRVKTGSWALCVKILLIHQRKLLL